MVMASQSSSMSIHWRSKPSFTLSTVTFCLFTDLFLYSIVVPILPFLLRDRFSIPLDHVQPYTSGLITAYSGASVLFSIPSGWAADKIGSRKPPFLAGSLLLVVGTTMFAFGQSFAVLMIARGLQGMAAAVVWSVGLAMIQDTVGSRKMGQAIGTIYSIVTAGELVAPVLGGMLYDAFGINSVFDVAAGVLAIDLILRLLLVDSKAAAASQKYSTHSNEFSRQEDTPRRPGSGQMEAHENSPLLPNTKHDQHKIHGEVGSIIHAFPVLYCFREPRFLMALYLSIVQGCILSIFDATLPTEAAELFHFSSLKVGLLFTALLLPYIGLGPVAGMAMDKYGTKVVATSGFILLVPCLAMLGIPSQSFIPDDGKIGIFCVVLALNGFGLSITGPSSFVEASDICSKYEAANPGFFGENGPYAQLFGFTSMFLFSGMAIGPLLGGALRESYGYGVMGLVFAALSSITAVLSYVLVGGTEE
ncbi:hypothetical protein HYFRA_00005079 [Hymenoscyphus fraxineus]|uniref:Major facilitator superfamily (MFS) profile domain-containing protein n=1 Tax=Hymenoscyphus fraxineus TaxID=746836 RepID=A0A9N9LEM4_9HELO|nr:hypothetical protein HYFRA_00005079 [Hymenoscyphus fraxineus]